MEKIVLLRDLADQIAQMEQRTTCYHFLEGCGNAQHRCRVHTRLYLKEQTLVVVQGYEVGTQ